MLIKQVTHIQSTYSITLQTNFHLQGDFVLKIENTSKVSYLLTIEDDLKLVNFDFSLLEMQSNQRYLPEMIERIKKFTAVTNPLRVEVSESGKAISVLNETEIYRKWQQYKQNEILDKDLSEEHKEALIKGHEQEIRLLEKNFYQSPIHTLFFCPIYNKEIGFGTEGVLYKNTWQSKLVQELTIPYYLYYLRRKVENNILFLDVYTKVDSSIINAKDATLHLQETFNTTKDISFQNYQFSWKSEYEINIQTGEFLKINSKIHEILNDMFFETTFVIEKQQGICQSF